MRRKKPPAGMPALPGARRSCGWQQAALHLLFFALVAMAQGQETLAQRKVDEDVNSPEVRQRQHLTPDSNLLFNGLGLSPAGQAVRISDMPLKMLIAPDGKAVVAVCAGYNEAGLNLVDLQGDHERQFISLKEVFNGIVFSADGKRFYVTGGDRGVIYIFKYKDGKAELEKEVEPASDQSPVFSPG